MSKVDLKVGVFVLMGLLLAGAVIFLIGDARHMFDPAVEFEAAFEDVQGLKRGSPVQMGGVGIGTVKKVDYAASADDTKIYVTISIVRADAGRIRQDSVAKVANKGFLGDKMVIIAKGEGDILPPGSVLNTEEPADLFKRVDKMAGKAEATMDNVGVLAESLADARLHRDIRESARSINVILKQVSAGDGYPHRFLTDPAEAARVSRTLDSLNHSATALRATTRALRLAAHEIRTGPGFAHDMLYGQGASKELAQLGGAAAEVGVTLKAIREGDGLVRDMLFGGGDGDQDAALRNVTAMTADLRAIVHDMRQGKGTIGALLVDPSIYEDVKRVLGNVERNNVLRALVRYSIKRDQSAPRASVKPGAAPSAAAPGAAAPGAAAPGAAAPPPP